MRFGNIGNLCQTCGRMRSNHTTIEAKKCQKTREIEKQKRYSAQELRLELMSEIVKREKKVTLLFLSREITKSIPNTSMATLAKLKKPFLSENPDIRWDGQASVYYVDTTLDTYITNKQERIEKSFSLSQDWEDMK